MADGYCRAADLCYVGREIKRAPVREPEPLRAAEVKRDSVAIVAPVEQVVDTNFDHLDVAVVGGERIAGKERGRGRNDEGPVA